MILRWNPKIHFMIHIDVIFIIYTNKLFSITFLASSENLSHHVALSLSTLISPTLLPPTTTLTNFFTSSWHTYSVTNTATLNCPQTSFYSLSRPIMLSWMSVVACAAEWGWGCLWRVAWCWDGIGFKWDENSWIWGAGWSLLNDHIHKFHWWPLGEVIPQKSGILWKNLQTGLGGSTGTGFHISYSEIHMYSEIQSNFWIRIS